MLPSRTCFSVRSVYRRIREGSCSDKNPHRLRNHCRACRGLTGTRLSSARSSDPRNRSDSGRCNHRNYRNIRRYSDRDSLGTRQCQLRNLHLRTWNRDEIVSGHLEYNSRITVKLGVQ